MGLKKVWAVLAFVGLSASLPFLFQNCSEPGQAGFENGSLDDDGGLSKKPSLVSIAPASGDYEALPQGISLNFDRSISPELLNEIKSGLTVLGNCGVLSAIQAVTFGNSTNTVVSVELKGGSCASGQTVILNLSSQTFPLASVTYTYRPIIIPEMKWDPSQSGTAYMKILNSSLSVEKDDADDSKVVGTAAAFGNRTVSSGKWYFEVRVDSIYNSNRQRVGVASLNGRVPHGPGSANFSYGMDFNGTLSVNAYNKYTNTAMGSAVKAGDIIGVALDLDADKVKFYLNGKLQGETAVDGAQEYSPMFFASNNSNALVTANFGKRKMRYTVPSGHKAFDVVDTSIVAQDIGWDKSGFPSAQVTFSSDGYTATKDDKTLEVAASAYGKMKMANEKLYYELKVSSILAGTGLRFGVASTTGRVVNTSGGATAKASYDYDARGGTSVHEKDAYKYTAVTGAPQLKKDDVVGVAYDRIAGTVTYYVNGTKRASAAIDKTLDYSPHFHGSKNNNGASYLNVGQAPFKYAPPARHRALISKSTNF